jgi:hypothetical protein
MKFLRSSPRAKRPFARAILTLRAGGDLEKSTDYPAKSTSSEQTLAQEQVAAYESDVATKNSFGMPPIRNCHGAGATSSLRPRIRRRFSAELALRNLTRAGGVISAARAKWGSRAGGSRPKGA